MPTARHLNNITVFTAAVVETLGGWHKDARDLFVTLAKLVAGRHMLNTWQVELARLYQRLAISLARDQARALLLRKPMQNSQKKKKD